MPVKPRTVKTNSSVDVLNAIRNSASTNYQNYVPIATPNAESVKAIGAIMMDNVQVRNEFISTLINRIAIVYYSSRSYENPLKRLKKGVLQFGEVIEDVFVELSKPLVYSPEEAETTFAKREIPDVKTAFYVTNYEVFYKQTIQRRDLEKAFLSWSGVDNFIEQIIARMYTSAEYDEFLLMKYLIAVNLTRGTIKTQTTGGFSSEAARNSLSDVLGASNLMTFMSPNYNIAGVRTHSPKNDQVMLVTSMAYARMMANVDATSFNKEDVQFLGDVIMVDSFGSLDVPRLDELIGTFPDYHKFTDEEMNALNAIDAIIIDVDWYMIFDRLMEMRDFENYQGLYWNYALHTWKVIANSPFANALAFVDRTNVAGGNQSVTSVQLTKQSETINRDGTVSWSLGTTVNTTGVGTSKEVIYTVETGTATISPAGEVKAANNTDSLTVKATSVFDSTKSATLELVQ